MTKLSILQQLHMDTSKDKPLTLANMIEAWIGADPTLSRHFAVGLGEGRAYVEDPSTPRYIVYTCNLSQWSAARINDKEITFVFARRDFYKFHAAHPYFFQKLRGWLYDFHNRNQSTCQEYLR
jgi:hypothetical protein